MDPIKFNNNLDMRDYTLICNQLIIQDIGYTGSTGAGIPVQLIDGAVDLFTTQTITGQKTFHGTLFATGINTESIQVNTITSSNIHASTVYSNEIRGVTGLFFSDGTHQTTAMPLLTQGSYENATVVVSVHGVISSISAGTGSTGLTGASATTIDIHPTDLDVDYYLTFGSSLLNSQFIYGNTGLKYNPNDSVITVHNINASDTITASTMYAGTFSGSTASVTNITSSNVYASTLFSGPSAIINTITSTNVFASTFSGSTASVTNITSSNVYASTLFSGPNARINDITSTNVFATTITGSIINASTLFSGPSAVIDTITSTNVFATTITGSIINASTLFSGPSAIIDTITGASVYGNTGYFTSLTSTSDSSFNSVAVGHGNGNIGTNTVLGYQNLNANSNGSQNVAVGYQNLYTNTTAVSNVAVGYQNLFLNTIGTNNTAIGQLSLYSNTSGTENVAIGKQSLYANTTGYNNVAIGQLSNLNNVDSFNNTSVGSVSLFNNTSGNNNSAFGVLSGYGANGISCTYIGFNTTQQTPGNYNFSTALGYNSQITKSNQIVLGDSTISEVNVPGTNAVLTVANMYASTLFSGPSARIDTITSANIYGISGLNFLDGTQQTTAYKKLTTGSYTNTTVVVDANGAISSISTGTGGGGGLSGPIAIIDTIYAGTFSGSIASVTNITGANVYAGTLFSGPSAIINDITSTNITATTITGTNITASNINAGTIYATGTIYANGTVSGLNFSATSDYRIKENVKSLTNIYTVDNLKPVTYYNKLSKTSDIGFIAHEVQELFPELVYGEKDGPSNQSINYSGIVPILVKDIKELKKREAEKDAIIKVLESTVKELGTTVKDLMSRIEILEKKS